jgi:hydrogenase-4 component B
MTTEATLLLPVVILWPLLLAVLCLVPKLGPRMLPTLPLGPLPALAAVFLAPRDDTLSVRWVLLDGGLRLTETGVLFLGGAATLWFWAGVYALRYMRGDPRAQTFVLFWMLVLAGNLGVFLAADLASFYVYFALVSLAAYPLVIHDRKPASMRAGAVYIILAVIGETALLAGFLMAAQAAGGTTLIEEIRLSLAAAAADPLALWLLIAGFGIKAGLVPLHVWLPVAHPAAPVPASAVLSGAIVKAGIFGLVAFLPWGSAWPISGTLLALAGFGGLFAAALYGAMQVNPKTVLAYSTVSQMGLLMGVMGAALAAGLPAASVLPAVALYALHHGLAKGALFLGVGVAGRARGVARGLVIAALALIALSVAGLPLTAGALAKSAIKGPAGDFGATLIGLSALTSGLLLARFLFTLPETEKAERLPGLMVVPIVALAAAALTLPWSLYAAATGKAPYGTIDLLAVSASAWPLGLAAVLVIAALGIGLRAPSLPEGDLLGAVARFNARAVAAAQAAASARRSERPVENGQTSPEIAEGLERLERLINDHTATSVTLILIALGLFAALA